MKIKIVIRKIKFGIILIIGAIAGVVSILYLRSHDPKYGFDIIADRIIPIGFPSASIAAALFCAFDLKSKIWVSALTFPLGALISMLSMSIYYSYPVSLELFALPAIIFMTLYVSGILGAFAGKKLYQYKESRS